MLGILKEILAVILFEPKPITKYQKISEKPIAQILLLLVVALGFVLPMQGASFFANYFFFGLGTYLVIYIAAVFFQNWFRFTGINAQLKPLFVILTLALAMNILILPVYLLASYFDSFVFIYINEVLVSYSLFILIFALAKSVDSSLIYVILGTAICSLPVFFALTILHALFIYIGFLPLPVWET